MRPADFEMPSRLFGRGGVSIKLVQRIIRFLNSLLRIEIRNGQIHYADDKILIEVKGVPEVPGDEASQILPFSITYTAGELPSAANVKSGIEAAYTAAGLTPITGDILYSTQLNYIVAPLKNSLGGNIAESDIFRVRFVIATVSYTAINIGPARFIE